MKAAVLEAFGEPLVVREVPDPTPTAKGAVIRVEANGICRSDWHAWRGDWPDDFVLPHVLGHEMCGVVETVGPEVEGFRPGDRVIVCFSGGEGSCALCRGGLPHLCERPVKPGIRSWGGYARYAAVDHADLNLIALPEALDFVAGAGMGCRFMTAFHGLVDRGRVAAGEWVAVHGCGGVGLSAVQVATALGAHVVGVDVREDKLAVARDLGAVATVDAANSNDPAAQVRDITGGGAHVAVDALGIAATCRNGIQSLRKRGRHVQIGLTVGADGGDLPVPVDLIALSEIEFIGSVGMPAPQYEQMLRMVAAGRLDPARLVGRTVALEEASDVLQAMDHYDTLGFTVIDRY